MIEVKNHGTSTINLSIDGEIVTIKPAQCCRLNEDIYKSYSTIFPALRPVVEYAIIEADEQLIEQPKAKKNVGKGKKRGK